MRAALLAAVLLSGCVSPVIERKLEIETFTHDQVLSQWDSMSEAQKKRAYKQSRDSWWAVRYHMLGDPLPDDLRFRKRPYVEEIMPDDASGFMGR